MSDSEKQVEAALKLFDPEKLDESFKRLPAELQEKTIVLHRFAIRAKRATKQFALWRREHEAAAGAWRIAQADHSDAISRWNPTTNTMTELEDAPEISP
jgi:adenylyl- and sulfurtransferase ThiI